MARVHASSIGRRDPRSGFTLVELMASLVALATVTAAIYSVYDQSTDAYVTMSRLGIIQEEGRRSLEAILDEARFADKGSLLITQENGSDRLDFRVPADEDAGEIVWSEPIILRYEPSSIDSNGNGIVDEGMIVRIQGGARRVLCHHVEQGELRMQREGDLVTIRLRLITTDHHRAVVGAAVESSVRLRNGGS